MAILQRDVRASDHDRETAVALLKAHYTDGRLSDDELSWRTHAAYRAEGMRELAQLTSDLPRSRPPRRRRRPPYVALGTLCLLIALWMVVVPVEVTAVLTAVFAVLAALTVLLLAPLWIPALLAFIAWRVIKTRY
jgi:hypothetical protein